MLFEIGRIDKPKVQYHHFADMLKIAEKIREGKAIVATAEEIIGIVKQKGVIIIKDDDVGLWGEVRICQLLA